MFPCLRSDCGFIDFFFITLRFSSASDAREWGNSNGVVVACQFDVPIRFFNTF